MKYEYQQDNLKLCILLEDSAEKVLKFYHDNEDAFDKYEADKPADFYTLEYQQKMLYAEHKSFMSGNYVRFFLFDDMVPDKIIGTVSFSNIKRGAFYSCQIGYKIDCALQNKGYGYKMLKKAIEIIVCDYDIHRIEAFICPTNQPSETLVKKLGFLYEGVAHSYVKFQGNWTDHLRYAYIAHSISV